jgi:hypothetical protein
MFHLNHYIMNVKLVRSYRSKNGNIVFVYTVTGNASDLAKFKDAQGEFYREDDKGNALWFTTRCIGQSGKLVITTNGNVVPDMSAYDQAASLAAQYGGNFGQALANAAVAQVMGTEQPATEVPAPQAEVPASDETSPEEL